ncbi:MAG: serine/threonine protein kinase, partial [Anaerolineales bacterium]|nr:serine/threonine protein kinase [Anaerolineales bacterium]
MNANIEQQLILNRYFVQSFLGQGGMARVYRVFDQQRQVVLALKLLHTDLAHDRVFLRRFRREAQTLAQLQHPHIVRFFGFEEAGRLAFLLMEYIAGESLKTYIFDANGPLSPPEIRAIFQPVCAALHFAHQMGYVHCDIKPGNIMIEHSGRVLVNDFGIARLSETATATMVGLGTPAYMAPEQIQGLDPTPQTDIYALGIILFELLTGGERPFTGEQ